MGRYSKYYIDHICGHGQWHNFMWGGPDVRARIANMSEEVCPKCAKSRAEWEKISSKEYKLNLSPFLGDNRQIRDARKKRLHVFLHLRNLYTVKHLKKFRAYVDLDFWLKVDLHNETPDDVLKRYQAREREGMDGDKS
jgi:hypothetical protein